MAMETPSPSSSITDNTDDDSIDWEMSGSDSSSDSDSAESVPDSTANPSEVTDFPWVCCLPPKVKKATSYGKWLVFRPYSQIDETWHLIRIAIEWESGVLSDLTESARCSGLFYNPSLGGPGPVTTGVIIVYTTEENVDGAGFVLIDMLKHDIKYKTHQATKNGEYYWKGKGLSVCLKTLYWNNGSPSFDLEGEICPGPRCHGIKDEWHINCVTAPEPIISMDVVYGRWVIVHEDVDDMTGLWHLLKETIESGELGAVKMVCPPKINFKDQNEKPVFLLYTGRKNKEFVGLTVANTVKKDMAYELRNRAYDFKVTYNHRIVWNDGDPEYIMTLVRPRPHRYRQPSYN